MKINEKFLAAYANSAVDIEKEGYLSKKGNVNRGYQRRWFVLKGNLLFYFEKKADKQPIGVIILEDCNVDVCDSDRFSFTISFFGDNTRVYVLCAYSEDEMISWMKKITMAPYNYTHMVMTELEKKLIRLKENERKSQQEENDDLVGAVANDDLDLSYLRAKSQGEASFERKKSSKTKASLDRNTIAVNPKSFNNLLTVVQASKNIIQGVRRSKSSENLNKILQKGTAASPVMPQKKVYQSIRRKVQGKTAVEVTDSSHIKECLKIKRKDTFLMLHDRYAASIWTLIREFEIDSNEDLMRF